MVASCCAFNCTNRFVKGSGIHLFRFPLKKKELLAKWIKAIRRDNWEPSSTTFICSEHFSESCIRRYALQFRLKEDAVPSIFDFQSHLKKKVHNQRQPPAIKQETVRSLSTMEGSPVALISPVSEDHKMLQQHVCKGQQSLMAEVLPSKSSLTPDLPTTSASCYSCNVDDEKLQMQEPMLRCEDALQTSVAPDLPTTSAVTLRDDALEQERKIEKSPIRYLAVPVTSATTAMSCCDDGAGVHRGQQSSTTYRVVPVTARPMNNTEIRSAQHSVTNMHTYAVTTSPHLLKLRYEQLLQYEKQRYKELYRRLAVAQRCLQRRKIRMDMMKNTIKHLKLKCKQSSATFKCEKGCGSFTTTM